MESIPEVSTQLAPDAATEALTRYADSVHEFLKYQHVYAGGAQAQKQMAVAQAENRAKDKRISELESAIAVINRSGNKEVNRMKLENAEIKQEMSGLGSQLQKEIKERVLIETQLKRTRQLATEQETNSRQSLKDSISLRAENEELKAKVQEERVAIETLSNQLNLSRSRLNTFADYTTYLVDLDLPKL